MYSIVGLGNPGKEYSKNRHNAGYIVVNELFSYMGLSAWKKKFKGSISKGLVNNKPVTFLKPGTFMNLSGESVLEIKNYLKIPTEKIIIIHDDLDLSIGKIKAKFSGGNAGHKGLNNISKLIGNNYFRIRIGIGHPGKDYVSRYVLENFNEDELILLEKNITYIRENIYFLMNNEINLFNEELKNYL
tara:strand:+ start:553 stop:1113 length:561 start_codon:yes stop_codon:yes gene_type:complete